METESHGKIPMRLIILFTVFIVTGLIIGAYRMTADVYIDLTEVLDLVVPHARGFFFPEFNERVAYIVYMISVPLVPLLLAVCFYFAKMRPMPEKFINHAESQLAKITWALIVIFVAVFLTRESMHLFLIENRIFHGINLLVMLIIFSFICIHMNHKLFRKILIWFLAVLCIGITGFTFFVMFWRTGNLHEHNHHYSAYVASISAVLYGGRTLLVDYFPQYGLYAYLVAPIFRIFHLNVSSFSVIMGILMIIALVCNYMTLKILVKDKLVRLLAYFNIVFFATYFHKVIKGGRVPYLVWDTYYQYFPHRFLFPSIIALLFVRYAKIALDKSGQVKQWRENIALALLILFSFLGVIWNLDSGLVAFGAVLVGLGFITFGKCLEDRLNFRVIALKWSRFIIYLVGVPLLAYLFLVTVTFARTGETFVDFAYLFFFQATFYNYGFFMIRMPYIHPWALLALAYLVGISIPVVHFVKAIKERAGLSLDHVSLLFLSVMGVGLFSYYQGRSHDYNLNKAMVYLFPVLALLVDKMDNLFQIHGHHNQDDTTVSVEIEPHTMTEYTSWKRLNILRHPKLSCFVIAFFLFMQPYGVLINPNSVIATAELRMEILNDQTESTWAELIMPLIEGAEDLIILTERESYIAAQIGRFSSIGDTSFIEMFRMEALENIIAELTENTDRLVLIDTSSAHIVNYYGHIVFSSLYRHLWWYGHFHLMQPIRWW